jgi:hypothetical protein
MSIAIKTYATSFRVRPHSTGTYILRRMVVALMFVAFAVGLSFVISDTSAAADQGALTSLSAARFVIALPTDTMWTIAQRVDPYANVTQLVDQMVLLNGGTVTPGQKIQIP